MNPNNPPQGEIYGAKHFAFAAPGDRQSQHWILKFDDAERRDMHFKDADEAWAAWNQFAPSYNCSLFTLASLSTPPATDAALREVYWLIERRCSPPQYAYDRNPTGIGCFYHDVFRAHRHMTKKSAEESYRMMPDYVRAECFVSEHMDIAPTAPDQAPSGDDVERVARALYVHDGHDGNGWDANPIFYGNWKRFISREFFEEYCAKARAAIAAMPKGRDDEWQDISTAPETVERCFLWCADLDVYKKPRGLVTGRVSNGRPYGDGFNGNWSFTHWMPSPEPPAAALRDRAK